MEPAELLVFLILLASPDDAALAERLQPELDKRAKGAISVVIGKAAVAKLLESDLTTKDLMVSPKLGRLLTRMDKDLVILHISQRVIRGDNELDCHLWFEGRRERLGGVAGEGGDVFPFLHRQVLELLQHRFDGQGGVAKGVDLAGLAERGAWEQVLVELAAKADLGARDHYYRVVAYSRLNRRQAAIEAFSAMKEAHGKHLLVAAALEALPPEEEAPVAETLPESGAATGSEAPVEPAKEAAAVE